MRIALILFTIVLFISSSAFATAQILSPTAKMVGDIDPDATIVTLGKTRINGEINGLNTNLITDKNIPLDTSFFPIIGEIKIKNIDSIKIFSTQIFDSMLSNQGYNDLLDNVDNDYYKEYQNIDIYTNNGFFYLLSSDIKIDLSTDNDFSINAITSLNLYDMDLSFIMSFSNDVYKMNYQGNHPILSYMDENSSFTVKNSENEILWENKSNDYLLLIEDQDFTIEKTKINIIPLASDIVSDEINIEISPADPNDIKIDSIISNITGEQDGISGGDTLSLNNQIQGFDVLTDTVADISNGALILINTKNNVLIDDSTQEISNIGFARGETFNIKYKEKNNEESFFINGDFKLIYLGDHFYTLQAKNNPDGVSIPVVIIILWVIAIVMFFLFRYKIKTELDEQIDNKIRKYALVFHIIAIIITFILMEMEISYQFGLSATSTLFTHGLNIIFGVFLGVFLLLWFFGYIFFSIPLGLIINNILRYFGIRKGGKGIGKGIGIFFIWFFTAFYIKLFINIMLSFIPIEQMMPFG